MLQLAKKQQKTLHYFLKKIMGLYKKKKSYSLLISRNDRAYN